MKRAIRLALSSLLVLSLVVSPAPIKGEDEGIGDRISGDFAYALDASGHAVVTAYNGTKVHVIVPEVLDEYGVAAIADNAFYAQEDIQRITLPAGLNRIGAWAFDSCYSLVEINLPEGLSGIGDYAFSGCESLTELKLPDTLTTIGSNPFAHTRVTLRISPDHPRFSLVDGVLMDVQQQALISYPRNREDSAYQVPDGTREILAGAFVACNTLAAVRLPEGLERIGINAFSQCENLGSIHFPSGLLAIGESAFSYCDSLKDIHFSDGIRTIGDYAFVYCSSLVEVTLPEGLTSLGAWAFGDCYTLAYVTLPASLIHIGEYAFENGNVIVRVLPGSYAQAWARTNAVSAEYAFTGSPDPNAPHIPDGVLAPLGLTLPKGKKHPVYSGPGEAYERAGNGKAAVSTNGWVQVFGREGDWLLIQYEINQGQLRFGYMPAGNIPQGKDMVDLPMVWEKFASNTTASTNLTDDPIGSRSAFVRLDAGHAVQYLGWMDTWAYVEVRAEGRLLRGFVERSALDKEPERDAHRPFDLRAVSWGRLDNDDVFSRYRGNMSSGMPSQGGDLPNVWLRLDSPESRADLETLTDFRVVAGQAVCSTSPIPLPIIDSQTGEWMTVHFMPKDLFNRGALEITLAPGESISNVLIACTRNMPNGGEETLLIPLSGIPEDSGYPEGGAVFTAHQFAAFSRTHEQMAQYRAWSDKPATIAGVLEDLGQVMPDVPEQIVSLPYDTPDAQLYLIQGEIKKEQGPFGVYDVTFRLENPPEGVWLAAYQQCGECSEIDAFDMHEPGIRLPDGLTGLYVGDDYSISETLRRDFSILLLVSTGMRSDAQIDTLIRNLQVRATFSAEKWNASYEQHGTTAAIGPRSSEMVDVTNINRDSDVLTEIP